MQEDTIFFVFSFSLFLHIWINFPCTMGQTAVSLGWIQTATCLSHFFRATSYYLSVSSLTRTALKFTLSCLDPICLSTSALRLSCWHRDKDNSLTSTLQILPSVLMRRPSPEHHRPLQWCVGDSPSLPPSHPFFFTHLFFPQTI